MPIAATTSLLVALLLAGPASAQLSQDGPVIWQPIGQNRPQPLPPVMLKAVEAVQFKPAGPAEKLPEPKVVPPRIGAPPGMKIKASEAQSETDLTIQTEPPDLDQFTRRHSDEDFYESLRNELRGRPGTGRITFPYEEPVSNEVYAPRKNQPMPLLVEPFYVSHKKLYFEQRNFERYGWDLGMINPVIEVGKYYYDLVMLPYHIGSDACHCYDSSAGKCLPGDPTPLLLYRERFSVTGLVFEAGTILGGLFMFP